MSWSPRPLARALTLLVALLALLPLAVGTPDAVAKRHHAGKVFRHLRVCVAAHRRADRLHHQPRRSRAKLRSHCRRVHMHKHAHSRPAAPAPSTTSAPGTDNSTADPETTARTSDHATTRAVGSPPLSDAEAAARVRPAPEVRGRVNDVPNHRVPTAAELAAFHHAQDALDEWNANPYTKQVTGNFTGTTDEIIQWGAWKWGIDEDILRAVAVTESWWAMDNSSQDGTHRSWGLMQILDSWAGTFPLSRDSTAFNVDFYGAAIRFVYDGKNRWLGDSAPAAHPYVPGDIWGAVGAWFAGAWYNGNPAVEGSGANWYIDYVQNKLAQRTWSLVAFTCGDCYG